MEGFEAWWNKKGVNLQKRLYRPGLTYKEYARYVWSAALLTDRGEPLTKEVCTCPAVVDNGYYCVDQLGEMCTRKGQ